MRRAHRRGERGFTILEAFIALVVLVIGLLGMASLQVVAVRANHLGSRMAFASSLSRDLLENMQRWDYGDPRLASTVNITSTADTAVASRWDLGRSSPMSTKLDGTAVVKPMYSDNLGDSSGNASNLGALTLSSSRWDGASSDNDGDGTPDFTRYWNVFNLSGPAQGRLVQVIVRWKEPAFGYRQIVASTFKADPAAMSAP
jgi:type IV pilus modification protein PilV